MSPDQATNEPNGDMPASQLVQVSHVMARIYKEHLGRGPDRVHSHYAGPDAIACFLEGTLTPLERKLTTLDEHQRLRDIRTLFQYTAEDQFRLPVEEITGRAVIAFLSAIDTKADVATELFVFGPTAVSRDVAPPV
jgi:uncharacterized protein YbcI